MWASNATLKHIDMILTSLLTLLFRDVWGVSGSFRLVLHNLSKKLLFLPWKGKLTFVVESRCLIEYFFSAHLFTQSNWSSFTQEVQDHTGEKSKKEYQSYFWGFSINQNLRIVDWLPPDRFQEVVHGKRWNRKMTNHWLLVQDQDRSGWLWFRFKTAPVYK